MGFSFTQMDGTDKDIIKPIIPLVNSSTVQAIEEKYLVIGNDNAAEKIRDSAK